MPQVVGAKQVCHAVIAQIIPRQLQILDVFQKIIPGQIVEVPMIQLGQVLCLESLYILSHGEAADLFNDSILELIVKKEVQVHGQNAHIVVVLEYFFKEVIAKLIEEVQRFLRNANFLGSLKELDRPQVDLLELYNARGKHSLTEDQCLFVDSAQVQHYFFGREV